MGECPVGGVWVGGTGPGLSAVPLADDDARLEKALREEYPAAEIRRDDVGLGPWVRALLRHLAGEEPHLDLPLDVQATAFQWRAVRGGRGRRPAPPPPPARARPPPRAPPPPP